MLKVRETKSARKSIVKKFPQNSVTTENFQTISSKDKKLQTFRNSTNGVVKSTTSASKTKSLNMAKIEKIQVKIPNVNVIKHKKIEPLLTRLEGGKLEVNNVKKEKQQDDQFNCYLSTSIDKIFKHNKEKTSFADKIKTSLSIAKERKNRNNYSTSLKKDNINSKNFHNKNVNKSTNLYMTNTNKQDSNFNKNLKTITNFSSLTAEKSQIKNKTENKTKLVKPFTAETKNRTIEINKITQKNLNTKPPKSFQNDVLLSESSRINNYNPSVREKRTISRSNFKAIIEDFDVKNYNSSRKKTFNTINNSNTSKNVDKPPKLENVLNVIDKGDVKNRDSMSENRFKENKVKVEVSLFGGKKSKNDNNSNTLVARIKQIEKSNSKKEIKNTSKENNIFDINELDVSDNSNRVVQCNSCLDKETIMNKYQKFMKKNEIEELKFANEVYYLGPEKEDKGYESKSVSQKYKTSRPNSGMTMSVTGIDDIQVNTNLINDTEVNFVEDKYDDENGNYLIKLRDHINFRYEIISELGSGSFGQAVKCLDHKTNEMVCIKIIKNQKKFNKQAKIEIKILEHMKLNREKDSGIVKIFKHFIFRNHICIVFELLDIDLYEMIKSQNFQGLEMSIIRKLAIQLLNSLVFLRKHKIIHCDLKPENILLKQTGNYEIKVIDFGSSCFENEKLHSYIQSRFYRSPEIILGIGYTTEIDIWSFGCIIAELFTGYPIFPGESENDQIGYFIEYLGKPPKYLLKKSKKKNQFFDNFGNPLEIPNSAGKIRQPNTKKIRQFLTGSDEGFQDLVKKCLEWDSEKRITPEEAILHPWITLNKTKDVHKNSKNVTGYSISIMEDNTNKLTSLKVDNKLSSIFYVVTPKTKHELSHKQSSNIIPEKTQISPRKTTIIKQKSETKSLGQVISKINLALDIKTEDDKAKTTTNKNYISVSNRINKQISFEGLKDKN